MQNNILFLDYDEKDINVRQLIQLIYFDPTLPTLLAPNYTYKQNKKIRFKLSQDFLAKF